MNTKIKRVSAVIFIICFILLLTLMSLFTLLKDKSQRFSYFENRMLSDVPQATAETVLSGTYMTDIEAYEKEYIILRDQLLTADALINTKILNRPVVNDIVITDSALLRFFPPNTETERSVLNEAETVANRLKAHSDQVSEYGGHFCYVAVPCQYVCFEKSYPWYLNNRSEYTNKSSSALFAELEKKGVDYIDMRKSAKNLSCGFGSTVDNHYGIEGAYQTYAQIIEHINKNSDIATKLFAESEFEKIQLPNRYLGSRARKLLGAWKSDEKLSIMYPKESIPFTRTDNGQSVENTVYSIPDKKEDVSYMVYMGGDNASTLIDTGRPDKPTALIYGDSFTNAVECISWPSFNKMYSFDFRHYEEKSLSQLIDELRPDIVICIRDYEALLLTELNGQ